MSKSLTSEYGPYLPYLRRYARSLFGSQEEGDIRVRDLLEKLISGEQQIETGAQPRQALYRMFYNSISTQRIRSSARLGTRDRSIMLLTEVEGFKIDEAAYVLGISAEDAISALATAKEAVKVRAPARILIIEDETAIARLLEALIEELGHTTVAVAHNYETAVAVAQREQVDLILADIHLGETKTGLDAVSEILRTKSIPAIFVTAHPEMLLTGEKQPEPTYLIAKPYMEDTLKATIGQALFFHDPDPVLPKCAATPEQPSKVQQIASIRNRSQVVLYSRLLVAALEPVAQFDQARQHNELPPELWVNDKDYLRELQKLVEELRALNSLLSVANVSRQQTQKTVLDLKEHFNEFLRNYAKTLGKSAGYATVGLIASLLYQAGVGKDAIAHIVSLIKISD